MFKNLLWLPTQRALIPVLYLFCFGNSCLYAQTTVEVAKLVASDGAPIDRMGYSVDIDGDTAVVGAFFHDHQGIDSGAAYVFVRNGDTWTQQAELLPSDGMAGDQAGFYQIAVDGDTILLGAHLHDDGDVNNVGAVYVFERDGTNWSETAKLMANDRQPNDLFGLTVALDGDTAIIGANGDDHPDGTHGSVNVYVRNGNSWTQQAKLVGREIDVRFQGFAEGRISIEDDTVAVGAWATDTQGKDSGTVYIFVRNGNTWSEQARLLPSDGKAEDQFGASTALDHDTLLVGACRCHDPVRGGVVYVYTRNGSTWTLQAKFSPADGGAEDDFGVSLEIVGDRAIIGAQRSRAISGAGRAYVFVRNDNTWAEQEKLLASDGETGNGFGISVSMEGDSILIGAWGAYRDALNTGAAYIFELSSEFHINAGHSGAWFNPDTAGQGQFIDVEPESQFMFISWFTYTDAASDNPNEQRWLTAQGNYSGDTAELALFETLGGQFDDPRMVTTTQIGEVTLSFSDCGQGQMTYSLDEEGLQGEFPLLRVIPGSENVCEDLAGTSPQAVDINAGMDGAWFDPNTPGQGFFIDSHPDPDGGNFIFVSWFTYGDDTASGQRWLTAQGSFEGSIAEIDVFETTGGSFDDPQATSTTNVGTMSLDFTDCSNALLTYSLPANGAEGDI
ncbi:MAG: FG-GAP repeat protein, partial [Lysobacterales bacterium]